MLQKPRTPRLRHRVLAVFRLGPISSQIHSANLHISASRCSLSRALALSFISFFCRAWAKAPPPGGSHRPYLMPSVVAVGTGSQCSCTPPSPPPSPSLPLPLFRKGIEHGKKIEPAERRITPGHMTCPKPEATHQPGFSAADSRSTPAPAALREVGKQNTRSLQLVGNVMGKRLPSKTFEGNPSEYEGGEQRSSRQQYVCSWSIVDQYWVVFCRKLRNIAVLGGLRGSRNPTLQQCQLGVKHPIQSYSLARQAGLVCQAGTVRHKHLRGAVSTWTLSTSGVRVQFLC